MPWVRFKTTIPASERAKAVHALDRSATVTGDRLIVVSNFHLLELNVHQFHYPGDRRKYPFNGSFPFNVGPF
jgi:hypothetical protein